MKKTKFLIIFLVLILGILSSFGLPPYNFYYINFITLPVFFLIILNSNYKLNFFIGWSFGFGYFASNLYWLTNSLTFDDTFKPLIPLALILMPLFLGLFYGLSAFLFSFFNSKKNFSSILLFAVILSFADFLRGSFLISFPWNMIVYSLSDNYQSIQILSIIGTYSLNLILITIFLIPSIFFLKISFNEKFLVTSLFIIVCFFNYLYGSSIINSYNKTEVNKLSSKIKIISPSISLERFFNGENPELILKEIFKISKPENEINTIFIFPEGLLNFYLKEISYYKNIFNETFSNKHKIIIGVSSINENNIYNSLVALDNNVNLIRKYDKNKLVPFGEYLPFEFILKKIGLKKITQGYQSFSKSYTREIIILDDIKFLPLICYEIIDTGKLNPKNYKFDLILNISEDGWFGNSIGIHQHVAHAKFRAIEEGKNVIRSTNNGITVFIEPTGNYSNEIKSTEKGFIEIKEYRNVKKTIFSSVGNKIFFYLMVIYISFFLFLTKFKRG
ncbi:MAG: apolipoprotein N-acyltransferase [Candidatus Pelagibacter sp.]